jgi:predicted nucleic acid-binding protein
MAPDTSVLLAAVATHHEGHDRAVEAVRNASVLVAHTAFEACSVLSRMPRGLRMDAALVLDVLERDFPDPWLVLEEGAQRSCLRKAVAAGIVGGALYDVLIAATAAEHGATLLSADRRASAAYQAIGAKVRYVEV